MLLNVQILPKTPPEPQTSNCQSRRQLGCVRECLCLCKIHAVKTGQCTGSLSADALDCKSTCMLVVLKTFLTSVKMIRSHILGRECGLLPYKGPCSTVHCSTKPCAPPFTPCARLTDPVMGLSAVPESYLTNYTATRRVSSL